jgi:nucleotide-binding universal stress UspA family protein
MTRVLAAVDNSAAATPVLTAARRVAELYGADVEAIHVREDSTAGVERAARALSVPLLVVDDGTSARLISAARAPDVAAVVVGARRAIRGRRPAGHVPLSLIVALAKPVVVVPPLAVHTRPFERVLVPLDGTRASAEALQRTIELACRSQLEVVALHVADAAGLAPFGEQPQHELDAWKEEFLARYAPRPEDVRLEVRSGRPGESVLRVADEAGVDLVALGWSRDLSRGRAALVREVLERSRVPVLLVATHAEPEVRHGRTSSPAGAAA